MRVFIGVVLFFLVRSTGIADPSNIVAVKLQRDACFGPNYSVEIRRDGIISYVRIWAYDRRVLSTGRAPVSAFESIVRKIQEIDFRHLADEYPPLFLPEGSPAPFEMGSMTTTTVFTSDGSKTVKNRSLAPESLVELEQLIQEACNIPRWIKESNQSMERTAARFASTLCVATTRSLRSTHALGGGRSSLSR